MTDAGKRAAVMFGVLLALVPLLLFTYFALSTRLIAEDYQHFAAVREVGIWEALLRFRGTWNGHFSSYLVFGVMTPLGSAAPPLFATAQLVLAFAAYSWVVNAVMAYLRISAYRRAIVVALAALMVTATVNGFFTAHAFYWYSSAVHFTWSVVMLLIGIALAVEAGRRLRGRFWRALAALCSAVYAFLVAGLAEMYLVFQLSVLALLFFFALVSQTGSLRRTNFLLALAACLGTLAALALTVSAPGFAIRSATLSPGDISYLTIQDQLALAVIAMSKTANFLGYPSSYGSFMLVAFASMFMAMSMKQDDIPEVSRRRAYQRWPIAAAAVLQLLFLCLLAFHRSDNPQVLSRFSYGFAAVIGVNLLLTMGLLALLWRRRFAQLLGTETGRLVYIGGVLLAVCLLFAMSQARSINYKASAYVFFTPLSLLLMLGFHLTAFTVDRRLKRLFWLSIWVTAGAIITLAFVVSVEIFLVRYVNLRSISATIFALMLSGMMTGVTLGSLIRQAVRLPGADADRLRWLRLGCLLVALTIGAGIVLGQARRIPFVNEFVDVWDTQHRQIIRLRAADDPAVFSMNMKRIVVANKMDLKPPTYEITPLNWRERSYYGLNQTGYFE